MSPSSGSSDGSAGSPAEPRARHPRVPIERSFSPSLIDSPVGFDATADSPQDVAMKTFWRAAIAVIVASMIGFAFYMLGGNLAYVVRGTTVLPRYDRILVVTAVLTLPFTAAVALAVNGLLKKAFGPR
jgi:hypothetical protein